MLYEICVVSKSSVYFCFCFVCSFPANQNIFAKFIFGFIFSIVKRWAPYNGKSTEGGMPNNSKYADPHSIFYFQ